MRDQARKILSDSKVLNDIDFISRVYTLVPDVRLISKEYSVGERISIAYDLLYQLLHERAKPEAGSVAEKEKEEIKAIVPSTKDLEKEGGAKFGEEKVGGAGKTQAPAVVKPDYYTQLGINENATPQEIRSAYRKIAREKHPDVIAGKLRSQGLSEDEIKIRMEQANEEFKDINEAFDTLSNERNRTHYNLFREKQKTAAPQETPVSTETTPAAKPAEKATPPESNISITFNPTKPETEKDVINAKNETEGLREKIISSEQTGLQPEEIAELKAKNLLPASTTDSEMTTGLQLWGRGAQSANVSTQVDKSSLAEPEKQSLYRSNYVLASLERTYPKESKSLVVANQTPMVGIQQVPLKIDFSTIKQFIFSKDSQGSLKLLSGLAKELGGKAKGKIKGLAKQEVKKLLSEAVKKGGKALIKSGAKAATQAGLETLVAGILGISTEGAGLIIYLALKLLELLYKVIKKVIKTILKLITGKDNFKEQLRDVAAMSAVMLVFLGAVGPGIFAGLVSFGAHLNIVGGGSIASGLSGIAQAFITAITFVAAAFVTPFIIATFVTIFFTIFTILIINNSAFVVPEGGFGAMGFPPGFPPPGANVEPCSPDAGADITQDLANRMQNGEVHLLPDSNGARTDHLCITPTMIILHSSGGYDNDDGNLRTYETLVQRNLACQFATDTNDTWLMQPFYENMVEMAWCANSWNAYGISTENAGECDTAGCRAVNFQWSACDPRDSIIFADPPPHPCDPETELAYSAVCEIMQQYNIPWCQIFTHDDVPAQSHTDPIGKEWVQALVDHMRNSCPTDNDGNCP